MRLEQGFSAFLKSLKVSSSDWLTMQTLKPSYENAQAMVKQSAVFPDPVSSWISHRPDREGEVAKLKHTCCNGSGQSIPTASKYALAALSRSQSRQNGERSSVEFIFSSCLSNLFILIWEFFGTIRGF